MFSVLRPHGILRMGPQARQGKDRSLIRVAFILEELKFGGTQRQTLELVSRLDRSLFLPELWMMAGGNDFRIQAENCGADLTWLSRGNFVGPESLLNLRRKLGDRPVDLLVLMTVIPNIWGRIFGRLTSSAAIIGTCRGGGSPRRQHEWLLWPLADHIICNTRKIKDALANGRGVPTRKISVIPNGINPDFFEPREHVTQATQATQATQKTQKRAIICVARLVPDKDHETLISAFALIAPDYPDVELRLVGDGPLTGPLRKFAFRAGCSDRVKFLGARSDPAVLMRQSCLFALSSIREGLPNAVLEAMAAGLPVVATNAGGLPEIVIDGGTGLVVPCRSPSAMASAMARILDNEETGRSFGQAGKKLVSDSYSMNAMVRRHEEVFLSVLGRSGATP